jgi:GTP-binding protein
LRIQTAEFVTSAARAADLPREPAPHVAMVGRSNVGKSSLINALARRRIARTSAAPGKTRLINLYRVRLGPGTERIRTLYLVDLPGYGYARGGGTAAREFEQLTGTYFGVGERRADGAAARRRVAAPARGGGAPRELNLADARPAHAPTAALLLVDARHPGLASDLAAQAWLAGMGLPYGVIATKFDQLTRAEWRSAQRKFETVMNVPVLPVSAEAGEGLDDLWKLILRLCSGPGAAPTPPPSNSPR